MAHVQNVATQSLASIRQFLALFGGVQPGWPQAGYTGDDNDAIYIYLWDLI
jgi:hypothetical protein